MHSPTLKWIFIRVIPGFVFMAAAIHLLQNGYEPTPIVLEYLYSSIFQGLAALVAVSLAIVYYVSDRLERLMEVHLADARKMQGQFYVTDGVSIETLSYETMHENMVRWFFTTIEPRWRSLSETYATWRARPIIEYKHYASLNEAHELKTLTDKLLNMRSYASTLRLYDDCASHLGRYKRAQSGWSKLPKEAALAFSWSLVTIMFDILLLATIDYAGPEDSSWAVAAIAGALLSILYMALLFRTLLRAYFGSDRIKGFKETRLPDSSHTWELIKEVESFYTYYGIWFQRIQ